MEEISTQEKIAIIELIADETLNLHKEPRLYRIQRYIELYEQKLKERQ